MTSASAMEKAREWLGTHVTGTVDEWSATETLLATLLDAHAAEERERAAKVADSYSRQYDASSKVALSFNDEVKGMMWGHKSLSAKLIANAIRSQGKP